MSTTVIPKPLGLATSPITIAPNFAQGIYESRPFKLFAINSGYWLVGLLITGGLLATWR